MLRAAVIGLQPAKFQARRIRDAARERGPVCPARRRSAPCRRRSRPGAELDAEILRHPRGRIDLLGGVEAERDRRISASAARRRNLRSPTTWLLTRMSFTPPRTSASASPTFCTHWPTAPCAICRSAIGGRFVRLGVRAHAHAGRARELRHFRDVAVESVEIDDQRRRIDVGDSERRSRRAVGSSVYRLQTGLRA